MELTGETPMQAAYSLYVKSFEPRIKANYSSVKNEEPIEIYSSKEFRYMLRGVQLVSKNSAYAPMIYTGNNATEVRILGLAVQYTRGLI